MEPLSPRNQRVQEVRRLARQGRHRADRRAFVVEGMVLVLEAARAGLVEEVFVAPDVAVDELEALGLTPVVASNAAIEAMATTVTPQPVIAVATMPGEVPPEDLADTGHVLLLDAVGDPGNAGTILRSAEASGAAGVVVGPGSADPYGPKVVRASAGAVFRVPIVRGLEPAEALDRLRAVGRRSLGTAADAGATHDQVDLTTAVIVMGNEAHGMGDDVRAEVDAVVRIPQEGGGESLNVAMAATILCFEAARQRRVVDGSGGQGR